MNDLPLYILRRKREKALAPVIIAEIAAKEGFSVADVLSDRRDRHLVHTRWRAYTALKDAGLGYSGIARMMNRDHSTVMYGIKMLARMDAFLGAEGDE